jgi:superfamily I DNA/RNA helicase
MKGLGLPVMIVAGIYAKTMPLRVVALSGDPAGLTDHEEPERSLFFVAATRARDRLIVTGWGVTSSFLEKPHA